MLTSTEQTDEALATYRRSESLLAGLAESEPSARAALAACRIELGFLLYLTGKSAEALAVYKLALADQEAQAAARDASNDVRHGLARTLVRIGVLLMNMDKLADSETELRAAMAIQQKLADDNPDVIKFRSSLAYSHYLVATVLMKTQPPGGGRVPRGPGDPAEAGRRQPRRHRIPQIPGDEPPRRCHRVAIRG